MIRSTFTCSLMMTMILSIPTLSRSQERASRLRDYGVRTISVMGVAEESMTPDLAELTVGIQTGRRTASDSLETNARISAELLEVLKTHGIAAKDIQTSRIDLSPTYDRPTSENTPNGPAPKILGYQVINSMVITIRDIKKIGELLDLVVKAGVNQVYGLSFSISNRKSMLRDLRKRALTDAREKADDAAKEVGMIRSTPLSIFMDDTTDTDRNVVMGSGSALDVQAPVTPISVGQEVVRVSVEVVYELKLPQ